MIEALPALIIFLFFAYLIAFVVFYIRRMFYPEDRTADQEWRDYQDYYDPDR